MLKSAIKESGLTLDAIALKLSNMGFSTTKNHLSSLQNAKIAPAAEKLNRALAEILNINEQEFLLAADFIKATPTVQSVISDTIELDYILTKTLKSIFEQVSPYLLLHQDSIQKLTERNYNPYNAEEFLLQLEKNASVLEKWKLYQVCINSFENVLINSDNDDVHIELRNIYNEKLNHSKSDTLDEQSIIKKVPVLKAIYADQIYKDSDIIEYKLIPVNNDKKYFILKVVDNSMIQEGIELNDLLLVQSACELAPTDIGIIAIENNPAMVRKVLLHQELCILLAGNPAIAPSFHEKNKISIIGKGIEVIKTKKLPLDL